MKLTHGSSDQKEQAKEEVLLIHDAVAVDAVDVDVDVFYNSKVK